MAELSILGYIILIVAICYAIYDIYLRLSWKNKPLCNFPFKWRGKKYWYSRSCAVVGFVFCYNKNGELYILANQRGSGTPDFQGYWNCPCGYVEYNLSGEENCQKEIKEETGIIVPLNSLKLIEVNTSPTENKQNITLKYYAILDGTINDYTFSTKDMEENEVSDVKWIKVHGEELSHYEWAFNHFDSIKRISQKVTH